MNTIRTHHYIDGLVGELCKLPQETGWVEFKENSAMVSRIIREAIEDKLVRPYDPKQGKKYAKYLPFWA